MHDNSLGISRYICIVTNENMPKRPMRTVKPECDLRLIQESRCEWLSRAKTTGVGFVGARVETEP